MYRLNALVYLFHCWLKLCGSPFGLKSSKQLTSKQMKVPLKLLEPQLGLLLAPSISPPNITKKNPCGKP